MEARQVLLYLGAQLQFRQVGGGKADIERLVVHPFVVDDRMHESLGDISDMDVAALEMSLEDDHGTVRHRTIGEIVDQQVDAHPRRHAEHRRET